MSYLQTEIPINLIGFLLFLFCPSEFKGEHVHGEEGEGGLFLSPAQAHCAPLYNLITRIYLGAFFLKGICHFLYRSGSPNNYLSIRKAQEWLRNIPYKVEEFPWGKFGYSL